MQQAIVAGDTLQFTTALADYPASAGWVLKYRLIPRTSGTAYTLTATADGDDHEVSVSATTTALWTAGDYSWAAYVEKDGESITIEGWTSADGRYRGGSSVAIKPDPRVITSFDNRSTARKVLDGLLSLYESYAAGQGLVSEYTIAGRSMRFRDSADLQTQIEFWKRQVKSEERAERVRQGLGGGSNVLVRF